SVGAQVGMLAGPALGGVLLATVGPPWAFGVTLVGFAGATALFRVLRPYPPLEEPSGTGTVREIRDGVVYAARRPDLLGTYVVDMVAMFLAMPVVLFPALAADVLAQPAPGTAPPASPGTSRPCRRRRCRAGRAGERRRPR